ncbi:MAG: 4Fe-4S dicluster domain-containing protein [Sulfurovum sp.]|nr:4Fe-4S dicluster domain-containing protein [Sulfurovum sp.]MCB4744711.1 4Fe-4S dicluster domain-containing protein [Sulfurovum sp.]MCB4746820.1 4Fe-4S dicluster domain-containing protein [Sulfurovum sp.]MCB4749541.1 4Fe-4S dicluster domain-containing protein [Sulfurovum sp.]MCB4750197.1 4Fe-4S dicluster domain-containing protein [Sulfurovum sp.]
MQDLNLCATEKRGLHKLEAGKNLIGWDEVVQGSVLTSFEGDASSVAHLKQEERDYSHFNSYTATVASWRVKKPVFNIDVCIDCQNCWVWCPDSSIISRDKQMLGIDYDHCKGCEVCVEVCPTNPKSLLMFSEQEDLENALSQWPEKKKKEKK